MAYLEVNHISHSFKGIPVLRDVSFSCEKGECICVMGPSGTGKTTLLRIITGLLKPDQGQILLEGTDITSVLPHERGMAMIFQEPALFPHTKVKDNIAYGMHRLGYTDEAIRQKTIATAEMMKIKDQLEKYPGTLSGGQARRAGFARAIIRDPKILLLDEPFSSLDKDLKEELIKEVRNIQKDRGMTMICVTHDEHEAELLGDRIVLLHPVRPAS